jgi:hypothetical protein
MPLNTQEAFERLGEHLNQIDAPLQAFAVRHGYTIYPKLSGGRYPNRRITLEGHMLRSIFIGMEEKQFLDGGRFDQFFPEIPYSIGGFTWIDDKETKTRWSGPYMNVRNVPFSTLIQTLELHLNEIHTYLSHVTESYIRTCNSKSPLG